MALQGALGLGASVAAAAASLGGPLAAAVSTATAVAAGLSIAVLAVATSHAIRRPLAAIRDAMTRLANDEYGVKIPAAKQADEIGEMARAIKLYTSSGTQMVWVESAVDSITRNVMIVAPDYKIVYLNKNLRELLTATEQDIRRDLPHFDAGKLRGRSMFIFHANPEREQEGLADLNGTARTEIKVGGRQFEFVVTPMLSKQTRVGFVVELSDVTEQAAVQNEVTGIVGAAMAGDFSRRIDLAGKSGFMGVLSEGINRLVDTMTVALHEVTEMIAAMASGDLSKRIKGNYQGELLRLKQGANATADKLAQVVGQTVEGMTAIKSSTAELSSGAADLSSRTEEQVASLEEISASIRRLTAAVQQSAEGTGEANRLAVAARATAESGGQVAAAAVNAVSQIEQSSQRISDIVGMIDEIAFQTNLLALNAAVEAARAGEAGRGFAVVAGEVRALAQRSSQASRQIKALILDSSAHVKQGVELVDRAGAMLGEIVTAVQRVSDTVAAIAEINRTQSTAVVAVQEAIGHIEQATQQNAALVEQTTAALGSADN
jgi:methyl-accepting chemotaxis protein